MWEQSMCIGSKAHTGNNTSPQVIWIHYNNQSSIKTVYCLMQVPGNQEWWG